MVNKKNKFLCTAVIRALPYILTFTIAGASALTAQQVVQFGPWYSDAATGFKTSEQQTVEHSLHPLEVPIIFFQQVISPQDGPVCRFHPTCSAYGRTAVARFGAFKGLLLAVDRLVRDNPYNPASEDPVPLE